MGKKKSRGSAPVSRTSKCVTVTAPKNVGGKQKIDTCKDKKPAVASSRLFESELRMVGLRVKEVKGDGNCFFRAIADQLAGDSGDHRDIRQQVTAHIKANEEQYSPFVEDDEGFQEYTKRMQQDGSWAGHMEVQAASLTFEHNINIYHQGQPCWRVINFAAGTCTPRPTLNLSYHDGDHYNSVRLLTDASSGVPVPFELSDLKVDSSCVSVSGITDEDVSQVSISTGCYDTPRIQQALKEAGGNIDQAVEQLIEALGQEGAGGVDETPDVTGMSQAELSNQLEHVEGDSTQNSELGTITIGQDDKQPKLLVNSSSRQSPVSEACWRVDLVVSVAFDTSANCGEPAVTCRFKVCCRRPADSVSCAQDADKLSGKQLRAAKRAHTSSGPMKISGKNRHCPCGSGRKYKKCCKAAHDIKQAKKHTVQDDADATIHALGMHIKSLDI